VAALSYVAHTSDRAKEKHYQAWQVINSAVGVSGGGGRLDAIRDLREDNVSIMGANLSGAWLEDINLVGVDLAFSNLDSTRLYFANLHNAYLVGTSLNGAQLGGADLTGAILYGAQLRNMFVTCAIFDRTNMSYTDMRGAHGGPVGFVAAVLDFASMRQANFSSAFFDSASASFADLREAHFVGSSLEQAQLPGADLRRAVLDYCYFSGLNLRRADLSRARISGDWHSITSLDSANVFGVQSKPPGFVEWAVDSMGAITVASREEWEKIVRWRPARDSIRDAVTLDDAIFLYYFNISGPERLYLQNQAALRDTTYLGRTYIGISAHPRSFTFVPRRGK